MTANFKTLKAEDHRPPDTGSPFDLPQCPNGGKHKCRKTIRLSINKLAINKGHEDPMVPAVDPDISFSSPPTYDLAIMPFTLSATVKHVQYTCCWRTCSA